MTGLPNTQLPDLNQAVVNERELNPLLFDKTDYLDLNEFMQGVEFLFENKAVDIHPDELCFDGVVCDEEMIDYLKNPAVSSSDCKQSLKTPLHYYHNKYSVLPKKSGEHFELGTFCHMAFLEPHLFDTVIVEPNSSLASNEGVDILIRFWEQFYSEEKQLFYKNLIVAAGKDLSKLPAKKEYYKSLRDNSGKTAIQEEHKVIIDIVKSNYYRYGNGIIPKLMKGAICEKSVYTQDEATGLNVKIRPDAMNFEENIGANAIISFKTTHADNLSKFMYDSAQYKYELSEGMYLDVASKATGRKFTVVITVMLQTVAPFLPAVIFWNSENLASGKYKYYSALQTIADCEAKQVFPGFDAFAELGNYGVVECKQPDWTLRELLPTLIEE